MSSTAFTEYTKNLKDVHRLILLHRNLSGNDRGKRALGHLTRGGLLLLCASWERYIETVVIEGAEFLCSELASFSDLPAVPQQKVRDYLNSNGTTWTTAQLTTNDWKQVYVESIKAKVEKLNTPKHERIKPLFNNSFGLADVGACWTKGTAPIDNFVTLRGEVAHRGREGKYIQFNLLTEHETLIRQYAIETDNCLSDYLRTLVNPNHRPWNRIL